MFKKLLCLHVTLRLLAVTAISTTFAFSSVHAQTTARRLSVAPSASAARVPLAESLSGRVASSTLLGHLSGETQLTGMALMLKPTAAQSVALDQLLADQQNPASVSFHQWLTPQQYGTRFGLGDDDLAVLEDWLQARGFTVDSVAPSRNRIMFTGTASAVEIAFGTTMQRYKRGEQSFFENGSEIQIPAALADVIGGVSGLSSFHLSAPLAKRLPLPASQAAPLYTTSSGISHYMVPWDVRQIFGTNTLISSGFDATGIKIGVLGQSAVSSTQLTYFQQKTGQTVKLPTMMLVPNTGSSNLISGDEGESELDLEYASGSAPGATVLFVYTGCGTTTSPTTLPNTDNCANNGVFDALAYAVTNNVAPILTLSYGGCEPQFASYSNTVVEPLLKQANAQGQTFFASSGDTGASSCEVSHDVTLATGGLSVSYPASSAYATAVGGTQLSGDTSTYWSTANNSYGGSAIGYIPEIAWNDTVVSVKNGGGISASGGGASSLFPKPSWQVGRGVPADSHRDVPDVSLPASAYVNGYLTCTADFSCSTTSQTFQTNDGGVYGGTSASAPNFAAILAIIEQANGGGALGNINPSLYTLAGGGSGTPFHDIVNGDNIVPCAGGTKGCSSTVAGTNGIMGYSAVAGYDQVTGLGSVSVPTLQVGLNPSRLASTVTVTLSDPNPAVSTPITFTAKVTGSTGTPTGSVVFSVDGTVVGSAIPLSVGTATYSSAGFYDTASHTVSAAYSGDAAYAGSTGSTTVVARTGKTPSSVTITVPTAALAVNTPVTLTAQVGSVGATGTILFSVDGTPVGSPVALTSAGASYTFAGFASTGAHTVTATYSGDATFSGSSSSTAFTVGTGKLTAPVFLTAPNAITTNAIVRLSANVGNQDANRLFGGVTPTGTVTFSLDGKPISAPITLGELIPAVNYVYSGFTVSGVHALSASYSGDATYAPTTTTVTINITSVLTQPAVYVGAATLTPAIGVATSLTATVSGTNLTPTGTIMFSVDGVIVGSAVTLTADSSQTQPSSTATIPYTFTTGGAHTVIATYSGDPVYSPATGSATISAVTPVIGAIGIASSPSSLSVAYGSSGQITLTVTSLNGYTGPVTISGLAVTASSGATFAGCYRISGPINPSANATASATLTITPTSNPCSTASSRSIGSNGSAGSIARVLGSTGSSRVALAIMAAGVFSFMGLRRRILSSRLLLFFAVTALAVGLGGCSGGGSSSTSTSTGTTSSSHAGTYTVRVTAVSAASASVTANTSFTLSVQ